MDQRSLSTKAATGEQRVDNGENSQAERNNQRQTKTSEHNETVDESSDSNRHVKRNRNQHHG